MNLFTSIPKILIKSKYPKEDSFTILSKDRLKLRPYSSLIYIWPILKFEFV